MITTFSMHAITSLVYFEYFASSQFLDKEDNNFNCLTLCTYSRGLGWSKTGPRHQTRDCTPSGLLKRLSMWGEILKNMCVYVIQPCFFHPLPPFELQLYYFLIFHNFYDLLCKCYNCLVEYANNDCGNVTSSFFLIYV